MKRIILGFMLLALSGCGGSGGKTAGVPDGTPLGASSGLHFPEWFSITNQSPPLSSEAIAVSVGGLVDFGC